MQPERKIAQLSMGIGELEQRCNDLLLERDQVENRALAGVQVCHRSYGRGEVVAREGKLFTVAFSVGQKQFVYPDAFNDCFLTTEDATLQADLERFQLLQQRIASMQSSIHTAQSRIEKLKKK